MGRGTIYEVAKKKGYLQNVTESDFYEDLDALHISYVSDSSNKKEDIKFFLDCLESFGFSVNRKELSFQVTKGNKISYFASRFRQMKQAAESMTLETFSGNIYGFLNTIQDEYGDVILESTDYGDNGCISMDEWIRSAEEGTYYLGGIVYMH